MNQRVSKQGRASWNTDVMEFVQIYSDDLPEMESLKAEMDIWKMYWLQKFSGKLPDHISTTLKEMVMMKTTFPNIYTALCILGTIPITTCQCERSVSALRRLKTYMRGTMAQERLNGLAALSVHRNMNISENEIIDKFARMHPRRMQMIDILHSDISVEPK